MFEIRKENRKICVVFRFLTSKYIKIIMGAKRLENLEIFLTEVSLKLIAQLNILNSYMLSIITPLIEELLDLF